MRSIPGDQTSDHVEADAKSHAFRGPAYWVVGTLSLIAVYLVAGPWVVLLLCACNDDFMDPSHPLGRAVELSLYPAERLAETCELYGKYFWMVLSPLGG